MKRIIFALCLLIAVTSCVSKKKYMVAENGRLAALSRERVLNRNLGQQKDCLLYTSYQFGMLKGKSIAGQGSGKFYQRIVQS